MNITQQAFLDALAIGESGEGKNYNVLFGNSHFKDFSRFPVWKGVRTSAGMTHAAGRYQFEPATWIATAHLLQLRDFSPESQDAAAWYLASHVYQHMIGHSLEVDLNNKVLVHIAPSLKSTWTSLDPVKFPKRYNGCLAVLTTVKPVH